MSNAPLLIGGILVHAAAVHSDAKIVSRGVSPEETTVRQFAERAAKVASLLRAGGIGAGDVVATLAWNSSRHLDLFYATALIGAVCLPLNPRLSRDAHAYAAAMTQPRLLFFDVDFAPLAQALAQAMPGLCIEPLDSVYDERVAAAPSSTAATFDEMQAAAICFTSGTTGKPKGVVYSHRSTVLHAMACAAPDVFGLSARDRVLCAVPMFHVQAWGLPYICPMVGTDLVLPGAAPQAADLVDLMERCDVTVGFGVPTVWLGVLEELRRRGRRPAALERLICGGAAMPPAMQNAFEAEFGITVHHAWGMTEMSPVGVVNTPKPRHGALPPDALARLRLRQGRPPFGCALRIVDDTGCALPHDGITQGYLQARGLWTTERYIGEATPAVTADGWFDTGDIATIDEDGFMAITDRAKDLIKSGGEWISSIEIERAALSHAAVAQAAAIAMADARWQERPLLIVEAKADATIDIDELKNFLTARLTRIAWPDRIEVINSMPIGGTGKIDKAALRARFLTPEGLQ